MFHPSFIDCVHFFWATQSNKMFPFQVYCIHGKMKKRQNVINKFKQGVGGVLLCTDVMARGIDIPEVSWVIQYDPPTSATAFVHRFVSTAHLISPEGG